MQPWLVRILWNGESSTSIQSDHSCFDHLTEFSWQFARIQLFTSVPIQEQIVKGFQTQKTKINQRLHIINGNFNDGFDLSDPYPEGSYSLLEIDCDLQKLRILTDQLGSFPIFSAKFSNGIVFSNSLQATYLVPEIDPEIDDEQVAVFLLSNMVTRIERTKTPFKNITRVDAAQEIVIRSQNVESSTYWKLENEHCQIQQLPTSSLVEHFENVLSSCIKDRVKHFGTNEFSLALSGGLDSTLIAALASLQGAKFKGFTLSHARIHSNDEWLLAKSVSDRYSFPHDRVLVDDVPYYNPLHWDIDMMRSCVIASSAHLNDTMALHSSCGLNGLSADNIIATGNPLWKSKASLKRALQDLFFHQKRAPLGLRKYLPQFLKHTNILQPVPVWIQPEFATAIQIDSKNQELEYLKHRSYHPTHNLLALSLKRYDWTERYAERLNYQAFDPYFDIRMVRFSLSLDPFAHLSGKLLQRELAKKLLPAAIVQRPKTILGDTNTSTLRVASPELVDLWEAHPDLGKYIQRDLVPHIAGAKLPPRELFNASKAFWLNAWLVGLSEFKKKRLP